MEAIQLDIVRRQLNERRQRLKEALSRTTDSGYLVTLLQEVDAALERMDTGIFGLCEVCHDPIEEDRLINDPLLRLCLDHLTESQQRELEKDLELASRIQSALLPKKQHLQFHQWEIYYHYQPAGPVSGDYCDIIPADDSENMFIALGDISGKGIAASLLMSHLHAIFHSLSPLGLPVEELMEQANRLFCQSTLATHYATLVCGKADKEGNLLISNAGHCFPILITSDGIENIEATGLPIGLFVNGKYQSRNLKLRSGDRILFYTDGLTEAHNGISEYGIERIQNLASRLHRMPPREMIELILNDLKDFRNRASDDLTLLVMAKD